MLKLRALRGNAVQEAVKRALERTTLYLLGQLPAYPPPPTGSKYRRTGTLGRSLTTEVVQEGSAYTGYIGSKIEYSPWVISDVEVSVDGVTAGPQAKVHAKRWWTLQGEIDKDLPDVADFFEEELGGLLK